MDKRELDFVDEYYTNVDLALLKKLTLIVPTYDRNYYLSRCLWYHAHFPFGQIIVADSSPENKKVVNRETVKKIQEIFGANVLYLEYEPEIDLFGGDIYDKWADAVLHADKEYTLICADREFLFPETLINCISYLSIHQDFGFICGRKYYIRGNIGKMRYFLSPRIWHKHPEVSDNPIERYNKSIIIKGIFQNSLLMNINRTKIAKEIYSSYINSEISDIRYGEYYIGYIGHLYAKSEYITDNPFKIRDDISFTRESGTYTNLKKSKESSCSRYPYFHQYEELGVNKKCQRDFSDALYTQMNKMGLEKYAKDLIQNALSKDVICTNDIGLTRNTSSLSPLYNTIYEVITKIPLVVSIWNNGPLVIRNAIQNIGRRTLHIQIPDKFVPQKIRIPKSPDFKIVVNIIDKTYKNHVTDTAISFYPKEW